MADQRRWPWFVSGKTECVRLWRRPNQLARQSWLAFARLRQLHRPPAFGLCGTGPSLRNHEHPFLAGDYGACQRQRPARRVAACLESDWWTAQRLVRQSRAIEHYSPLSRRWRLYIAAYRQLWDCASERRCYLHFATAFEYHGHESGFKRFCLEIFGQRLRPGHGLESYRVS